MLYKICIYFFKTFDDNELVKILNLLKKKKLLKNLNRR